VIIPFAMMNVKPLLCDPPMPALAPDVAERRRILSLVSRDNIRDLSGVAGVA
jgi:hypothetical protein